MCVSNFRVEAEVGWRNQICYRKKDFSVNVFETESRKTQSRLSEVMHLSYSDVPLGWSQALHADFMWMFWILHQELQIRVVILMMMMMIIIIIIIGWLLTDWSCLLMTSAFAFKASHSADTAVDTDATSNWFKGSIRDVSWHAAQHVPAPVFSSSVVNIQRLQRDAQITTFHVYKVWHLFSYRQISKCVFFCRPCRNRTCSNPDPGHVTRVTGCLEKNLFPAPSEISESARSGA